MNINKSFQLDFINESPTCFVAGLGSVGSFIAYGLSKMGLEVTGCDPDFVEVGNLHCQFFGEVGVSKAEYLSLQGVGEFVPCRVEEFPRLIVSDFFFIEFDGEEPEYALETVSNLVKQGRVKSDLFIYSTVGGEVCNLYAFRQESFDLLINRFKGREIMPLPCTSRGVIDMSFIAAGLAIRTMRGILKNEITLPYHLTYSKGETFVFSLEEVSEYED